MTTRNPIDAAAIPHTIDATNQAIKSLNSTIASSFAALDERLSPSMIDQIEHGIYADMATRATLQRRLASLIRETHTDTRHKHNPRSNPTPARKRDVQAVIVPRRHAATAAQAAKIATHYVTIGAAQITVDEGTAAWHVRAHAPGLYEPHSFRTAKLPNGIALVYGTRRARQN